MFDGKSNFKNSEKKLNPFEIQMGALQLIVADPGFPRRGRQRQRGRQTILAILSRKLHEIEKNWDRDRAHANDNCSEIILQRKDWLISSVAVGDTFYPDDFDPTNFTTCVAVPGALGGGETRTIPCDTPVRGRYITVYMKGRTYLTICELEVYSLCVTGTLNKM